MELIDYTGKLNKHNEYINMLDKIYKKCEYIEIVIIDGRKSNKLIDKFRDYIISCNKVSKWWGTETNRCNNLYRLNSCYEFFEYLKTYDTFCKYYEYGSTKESLTRGDYSETTDFGLDDIAFYDKDGKILLYTTTHEGYITISSELK